MRSCEMHLWLMLLKSEVLRYHVSEANKVERRQGDGMQQTYFLHQHLPLCINHRCLPLLLTIAAARCNQPAQNVRLTALRKTSSLLDSMTWLPASPLSFCNNTISAAIIMHNKHSMRHKAWTRMIKRAFLGSIVVCIEPSNDPDRQSKKGNMNWARPPVWLMSISLRPLNRFHMECDMTWSNFTSRVQIGSTYKQHGSLIVTIWHSDSHLILVLQDEDWCCWTLWSWSWYTQIVIVPRKNTT